MLVKRKQQFTALGCHIYAGGFTLGVRRHFKVLGHLEEGAFGVETAKKNLGVMVTMGAEIWPDKPVSQGLDLLYGNPPCASWSIAGVKVKDKEERNEKRWSKDARTDCTLTLFAQMDIHRPKIFIWECVSAAMRNGRAFIDQRAEECVNRGYRVHLVTFNVRDCGLPQTRKRFFFVASKVKLAMAHPNKTYIDYLTVRHALSSLPKDAPKESAKISDNYLRVLKSMQPGEKSLHKAFMRSMVGKVVRMNDHGGVIGRPGFLNQRLQWDEPAPTITGGPQFFHPSENRALTVIEQQVLCGYPADYQFVGSIGDRYAQIAKACLPPAADWIGSIARRGLSLAIPSTPGIEEHDYL